jgi:hypothetical protein
MPIIITQPITGKEPRHLRADDVVSEPGAVQRCPSRLVAAAEEERLSVQCNSLHRFLRPMEPVSSWCLISHLQYKFGGNALHNSVFGGESKMRFTSTALVIMVIAVTLLALMLFA